MGKLHYVNVGFTQKSLPAEKTTKLTSTQRRIEGVKLGQVVTKDLLKRIPPGSSHRAALRDPYVDFDVSGKALTDEIFQEISNALLTSISFEGKEGRIVKLEELSLKGNRLTARSLAALCKVVSLTARDLRDLDLSGNNIRIATADDAASWEAFLRSFERCCVLRRVDFSGNELGPKAFEILAKVYQRETVTGEQVPWRPAIAPSNEYNGLHEEDMSSLEGYAWALSIGNDATDTTAEGIGRCKKVSRRTSASTDSQSPIKAIPDLMPIYSSTTGLHAVPYLIFADTGMNDTCAMYFSYLVANHRTPAELLLRVPPAKAGPPAQQLEAYDGVHGSQGLIYKYNDKLGAAGTKVLELAEAARSTLSERVDRTSWLEEAKMAGPQSVISRRGSEASSPPYTPADRRRSIISSSSVGPEKSMAVSSLSSKSGELDRARSRIQGDTLRDAGPHSNDLWRGSLKMLVLARNLLIRPRAGGLGSNGVSARAAENHTGSEENRHPGSYAGHNTRSAVAHASAEGSPSTAVSTRNLQGRQDTSPLAERWLVPIPSPSPDSPVPRPPRAEKKRYRNDLPYGLDELTWARIIAYAAGVGDALAETQQLWIVQWAMDRGTLERETEMLGKPQGAQIWRVLEGMGCLAYS